MIIREKLMFYVLLVGFVIQAGYTIGLPVNQENLKFLLMNSLKLRDCARIVPYSGPLPIRFRRNVEQNQKKFGCIIQLDKSIYGNVR